MSRKNSTICHNYKKLCKNYKSLNEIEEGLEVCETSNLAFF